VADNGGWEDWRWDETLFAGAAAHYLNGRLPYADGLADALTEALALDGRGRLLDVGCGPGVVTLRLAGRFQAVVGLDPDVDMLDEAEREAARLKVTNATWVQMRAEVLPGSLGTFRVATFAQSFHWMDRPAVAAAVKGMLETGGSAVLIHAPSYRDQGVVQTPTQDPPHPLPPDTAIGELRRSYLGPDTRAGQGIRNSSPDGEDGVFRAAGFAAGRQFIVADGRVLERTADDVVAHTFSSSSMAPHLFGSRADEFEKELRELLAQASRSGLFSIRLPDNVITIWDVDSEVTR
jgi:SAM-dependent methyltransferase